MGWLKDMFGAGSGEPDYWDKKFTERMAQAQKEKDEIFDFSKNIDSINETIAIDNVKATCFESRQQQKETKQERKKEEKALDDLKMVINGAKLQCSLCTNPVGDLKVNFDTPTIQDKKTATVKEKDMTSLIFKGNCKKSPQSSSPCASVMQLGDWKNVGTSKVQEQLPLLLKSTIKCNYGGVDIKITDCGQRCEQENLDASDMNPEEKKIVSAVWMCAEVKEEILGAFVGDKISLLVKTRNYEEGETITIVIDDDNGYDVRKGEKELILTGTITSDGSAKLKGEVLIEKVADQPKHKTDKELEQEESEKAEIYITHNGTNYTRAEWKAYQDKWHDEIEKANALKNRSFWDSIKK